MGSSYYYSYLRVKDLNKPLSLSFKPWRISHPTWFVQQTWVIPQIGWLVEESGVNHPEHPSTKNYFENNHKAMSFARASSIHIFFRKCKHFLTLWVQNWAYMKDMKTRLKDSHVAHEISIVYTLSSEDRQLIVRLQCVRVWGKLRKTLRHQHFVCYNCLAHLCETGLPNVLFFLQLTRWFVDRKSVV